MDVASAHTDLLAIHEENSNSSNSDISQKGVAKVTPFAEGDYEFSSSTSSEDDCKSKSQQITCRDELLANEPQPFSIAFEDSQSHNQSLITSKVQILKTTVNTQESEPVKEEETKAPNPKPDANSNQ